MVGLAHRENPRKSAPHHAGRDRETHRRIGFARGNGLKNSDLSTAGRQPVHGRKATNPRPKGNLPTDGRQSVLGRECFAAAVFQNHSAPRPRIAPGRDCDRTARHPAARRGVLQSYRNRKCPGGGRYAAASPGQDRGGNGNRMSGHERPGTTRRRHPPLLKTAWYRRGSRAAYPCARSIAGGNPRRARNGPQG